MLSRSHFSLSALFLLFCFVLLAACGEDKPKAAPPKPPKAAATTSTAGRAGPNANAGASTLHGAGGVTLEAPVALKPMAEEKVPEADPSKVHAFVYIADPQRAQRLLGLVDASLMTSDPNKMLADAFGLPKLEQIDWTKPMLVALVEGSASPVVMVSTLSTDEFLTPLPTNPIRNRQGNDFSFPLGMTQTVYLNFVGSFAVLSSEWRHFPLVSARLKEIIETPHDFLIEGEAQVHEFELLSKRISRIPAPLPELSPGWNDLRVTLEDLIDTTQSCKLQVRTDDSQTSITLSVIPRETGLLSKLVKQTNNPDTSKSIGRLSVLAPRFWLWQNLRQGPLIVPGVPIALVSHTLRLLPSPVAGLLELELARAAALSSANLLALEGEGEKLRLVSIAEVADIAKFDEASRQRFDLLVQQSLASPLKPKAFGKLNQPDLLSAFQLSTAPTAVVEARYGNDFVAVSQKNGEDAARLVSLIGATPPSNATMPSALQNIKGTPLFMAALELQANAGEPITAAISITEGVLVLQANLPRTQLDLAALP